ncbi:septum formation inhibitor Maf [Pseudoalteromonas sp. JBTF-M23]|uniref:7-methyl-GTP pyrophosphatase n=1 Tax=Pseudoalteromonas caenipelagi TaxID=2726988 RepID=A0A849VCP3_9GAMM|nr:nucleoside triphosphate pyrophosphatase [Pseudoalteromonas caenipelagi]NOU49461.1 septum formation inhibitor Maf [Pseudoalteromonas caenipelagi]
MEIPLILASSSPYRQSILKKFNLPFESFSPDIDETPFTNESAEQLVMRLSEAKAKSAKQHFSKGLAIGSDQVALHNGKILGKPHTRENAIKQLTAFSSDKVTFLTGLCVFDIENNTANTIIEPFSVYFKTLSLQQIEAYCDSEQPYQCAGSFKSEGLGICLFDKLVGDDPNSLVGLPLIRLNQLLAERGFDVLSLQRTL